ncbi:MAG: PEGA domain-containing protein, partial [Proteobacteria bacterium]|nr:PEGA domain-containing protein [Pseudomonadota bacterium]
PKRDDDASITPSEAVQAVEAAPEDELSQSLPPKPLAATAPAIEPPQPDPTVMLPKDSYTTETRDRKILIITVCCVAALVSLVLSLIITTINNSENNEPNVFQKSNAANNETPNAKANDAEDLQPLFVPVEKSLTEHNWAEAQVALNVIKTAKPEIEKTDEFKVFHKRILIGQELEKIKSEAMDSSVIDKSNTLKALNLLLDMNKADTDVDAEVKLIQNEIAEYPTLSFDIENIDKTTLHIDGIEIGTTPESIVLEKGSHQILVKRSGYSDYDKAIEVAKDMPLEIKLVPKKSSNSGKKIPRNSGTGIGVGYQRSGNGNIMRN